MGLRMPATRFGFKGLHQGETIWVIGSGSSLDHIDPRFFDDKICVAVNRVGMTYGLREFYTVSHYHRDVMMVTEQRPDSPCIVPDDDLAGPPERANTRPDTDNIYFFPHTGQRFADFRPADHWPEDPDTLVVGPTSLHMTMHFGAYLGAASLVLVGADCGYLDDRSNFDGYAIGDNPFTIWQQTIGGVADQLRARGVAVHSLNPFTNFALEGHTFRGPTTNIN